MDDRWVGRLQAAEDQLRDLLAKDAPLSKRITRDVLVTIVTGAVGAGVGTLGGYLVPLGIDVFWTQLIGGAIGVALGANLALKLIESWVKARADDRPLSAKNENATAIEEDVMNLAVIGTGRSGKTTALLLLHLTATELNIKGQIGYRTIVTPKGMPLYKLADALKDGWPPSPTKPNDRTLPATLEVTFAKLLNRKKVNITSVDVSGELVTKLFEVLPSVGYDVEKLAEIDKEWGLTPEDVSYIYDYVLNSNAFLFIVDGTKAVPSKSPRNTTSQDAGLVQFLQNMRSYKETTKNSPKPLGVAVLLTKTDCIGQPTPLSRDPSQGQLNDFMHARMTQTYSQLINIANEMNVKVAYFYSWMLPETKDAESNVTKFITRNDMVEYPKDQFEGILRWAEKLG